MDLIVVFVLMFVILGVFGNFIISTVDTIKGNLNEKFRKNDKAIFGKIIISRFFFQSHVWTNITQKDMFSESNL